MSEDHIGVQINGVLYVKFELAKKLREGWDKADAEIEKLREALKDAADALHYAGQNASSVSFASITFMAEKQARAALGEKE